MKTFYEYVNDVSLADVIVNSNVDVNALCEGLLELAQSGKFSQQDVLVAWYGDSINEGFGLGGVAQATRGVGRGLGYAQGVGNLASKGLGWLGRKAMGGAAAVGQGVSNAANAVGQRVGQAASAVGQGVSNAANAVGQRVGQAASAVGQGVSNVAGAVGQGLNAVHQAGMQGADSQEQAIARKQAMDRIGILTNDLKGAGLDQNQINQMLAPVQQALQNIAA